MIFGKRNEHKRNWNKYFSLFPEKLNDGRWVWMETIERRLLCAHYEYRKIKKLSTYEIAVKRISDEHGVYDIDIFPSAMVFKLFKIWYNGGLYGLRLYEVKVISNKLYILIFYNKFSRYHTHIELEG